MKVLIRGHGFIGDNLFQASVAKKLKEINPLVYNAMPVATVKEYHAQLEHSMRQNEYHVTFQPSVPQPCIILEQNPFIDEVSLRPMDEYDVVYQMTEFSQDRPCTIQSQELCGIPKEQQSTEFDVYTVTEFDDEARARLAGLREEFHKPLVAYQVNWRDKAYQSTPEHLTAGSGAPHRDIDNILGGIAKYVTLIPVGFPDGIDASMSVTHDPIIYAKTASTLKFVNALIGSEGGMTNLAAALGTKCIITTDYIMQNYGPTGRVRPFATPQMGPAIYYPNAGHVHLDPCISDVDIPMAILTNL